MNALPVLVLWLATAWTCWAHIQQAVHVTKHGAGGVSVKGELHNLMVSVMLWSYALHLGDANLVVARSFIVVGWLARWAVAKRWEGK